MKKDINIAESFDQELDWEYSDAFYSQQGNTVRSFEEYQKDSFAVAGDIDEQITSQDSLLQKTVIDVENVMRLDQNGKNVEDIASELSLDSDYVRDILITLNSSVEDSSALAIARLMI